MPLYTESGGLQKIIQSITETTGVYKFYDENDRIIYVGKAKNLRKRILSYFKKTYIQSRIHLLVKRIFKIETINVENEYDALLLENTLIKQHQPKYNIRLKDDKSYPWICISEENYPRIFVSYNPDRTKNICYGPYPSLKNMNVVLDLVRTLYPLRTCKFNLTEKNIKSARYRPCLQYHVGKCLGVCEGTEDSNTYREYVRNAEKILKGDFLAVLRELKTKMKQYSNALEFEKAHLVKEKIIALENYRGKSVVINKSLINCEVISIIKDAENTYTYNFISVRDGAVIRSHSFEIQTALDEDIVNVFEHAIIEVKNLIYKFENEVIVPFYPRTKFSDVKFIVPKSGYKKELLLLSEKNANIFQQEKRKRIITGSQTYKQKSIIHKIQAELGMKEIPKHIEAFDNSSISGTYPVSACVVFINGKPVTSKYRIYDIKNINSSNDCAYTEEVIFRRYKRLIDEDSSLPQLILIDGGKGQITSAAKSLAKLNLTDKIKLIAIAKRLETIYTYGDNTPLYLDKKSAVFSCSLWSEA